MKKDLAPVDSQCNQQKYVYLQEKICVFDQQTFGESLEGYLCRKFLSYFNIYENEIGFCGNSNIVQQFTKMRPQQISRPSKIGWKEEVTAIKTQEEEELCRIVKELGHSKWEKIARRLRQKFPECQRSGRQCRERYMNYLEPNYRNQDSHEWEISCFEKLLQLYLSHGTKWSQIAKEMQHWSENFIKNKFNGILRKCLRKICKLTQERTRKNSNLKFKTLTSLMNFPQDGGRHSPDQIRKTQRVKQKILREALELEKGNENMEVIQEIVSGINAFTTKNKSYLMSLGKKKAQNKCHEISESSDDEGYQNVVVLKRPKRQEESHPSKHTSQIAKSPKKESGGTKTNEKQDGRFRVTAVLVPWPIDRQQQSWA